MITTLLSILAPLAPTIAGFFLNSKSTSIVSKGLKILGDVLNKPGASPAEIELELRKLAVNKDIVLTTIDAQFKMAMQHINHDFAIRVYEAGVELAESHNRINERDARSRSKYRSTWRPTLCWGLTILTILIVFSLAAFFFMYYLGYPMGFVTEVQAAHMQQMLETVNLDWYYPFASVLGIFGGIRGYEKVRGSE